MTDVYSGMGVQGDCAGPNAPLWETKNRCLPLLKRFLLNLILCSYRVIVVRLEHWVPLELLGPQALLALLAQLANKETEERL